MREFEGAPLVKLAAAIKQGRYDRIIIAGMGASLYAGYPVWQGLAQSGLPVIWVDAAELVHEARGLVTAKTLLWLTSQSGRSAEIEAALDPQRLQRPAALLATVNDLESPLAKAADCCIPIRAEPEATVSTRTYLNSLAVGQLAARALISADIQRARSALLETAEAMRTCLAGWAGLKDQVAAMVGVPKRLVLLGRGVSVGSAHAGALVLSEAAKFLAAAFQAAEFRHGPLEMAGPDLTVLIFEGAAETRALNLQMLNELRAAGTQAYWIGNGDADYQITIPAVAPIGLPLVEILPLQALSVHLADATGVRPGDFLRIGKVTTTE